MLNVFAVKKKLQTRFKVCTISCCVCVYFYNCRFTTPGSNMIDLSNIGTVKQGV